MVRAMQFPVEDDSRSARRHDPGIADVVRLVGLPEAEDHGIVVDHGDGHPVSVLEIPTDHTDHAYRLLRDTFPTTHRTVDVSAVERRESIQPATGPGRSPTWLPFPGTPRHSTAAGFHAAPVGGCCSCRWSHRGRLRRTSDSAA
jgi:hypothetical protein